MPGQSPTNYLGFNQTGQEDRVAGNIGIHAKGLYGSDTTLLALAATCIDKGIEKLNTPCSKANGKYPDTKSSPDRGRCSSP
jgi:hypothetical protein